MEGIPGMSKSAKGTSSKERGVQAGLELNSGSDENRSDAARALSTLSGAVFAVDGVGREIAGMFTAASDGIFF